MSDDDTKIRVLREIATSFDKHDLDRIMAHFTDDCVFETPRGPKAYGQRVVGKAAVRAAFADRFAGIPDVRYTDDSHFVSGNRGASEWLLSGTSTSGERIEVRGCDLWTFDGDKVARKDSYWKLRTP
jgi:ketosteroid isomerase-like protein